MRTVSVLMYGQDALLMETRRLLLQTAGYDVSYATTYPDFASRLRAVCPQLLIFCHSVPASEVEQALLEARAAGLRPRVLLLGSAIRRAATVPGTAVFEVQRGPDRLRQAVAALATQVTQRRGGRRGPTRARGNNGEPTCGVRRGDEEAYPSRTLENGRSPTHSAFAEAGATQA